MGDPVSDTTTSADTSAAAAADAAPATFDRAQLCALLGLDAGVEDAAIEAKLTELVSGAADDDAADAAAAAQLADLQAQLDTAQSALSAAQAQMAQAAQTQLDAELDGLMAAPNLAALPDDTRTALRALLGTDRPAAEAIIAGIPVPALAAAPAEEPPPAPVHDPKREAAAAELPEQTAAANATRAEALVRTVQGEGKFKDYESARAEARRRQPDLFS